MKPYYEQNGVTIYHGDCREVLPVCAFDVALTDPPYGIKWQQRGGGKTGKSRGMRRLPPIVGDADVSVRDAALEIIGSRPALVFGSFYAPFPSKVVQVLVYQKTPDAGLVGSVTGFRRDAEPIFLLGEWPSVNARYSSVVASRIGLQTLAKPGFHPHAKPLDVLAMLLAALPYGAAVDPFAGSGSILVAAKRQGRKAIGIEIEERHCETAAKRLQQSVLPMGVHRMTPDDRIVRRKEVLQMVGLSRTTLYRLEELNQFPKRVQLSPNAVGWKLSDVQQWMAQRAAA